MPQHLQMTRITVKGFATMEAVPRKLPTKLVRQPPRVTRLHNIQLRKTKNSLDALQCHCFFGEIIKQLSNTGHGSKTSLTPSLMQLPELKRAVTCDKNSGYRLHEPRRSEFSYELHIFSANVAEPSYPWPINFLRSSWFFSKKDSKAFVVVPASSE